MNASAETTKLSAKYQAKFSHLDSFLGWKFCVSHFMDELTDLHLTHRSRFIDVSNTAKYDDI